MEHFNLPVTSLGSVAPASDRGKVERAKKQLEEVIEIVRSDIDRIIERGNHLQNLSTRAGNLFYGF